MANYNATDYSSLVASIAAANNSAGVNDAIFLQNDITLTAAQFLSLAVPEGSGNLRFRSNLSVDPEANFTLTVVNDLFVGDSSGATILPSFTIGPVTLQIGNGGTSGGLSGNLRGDDDGILVFNRSVDSVYAGTFYLEEENGLRNDVAGTTLTMSGAASGGLAIASWIGGSGPSGWDLEIAGDGDGIISGVISDGGVGAEGNLVKEGEGTWTFAALNTYLGTTTVEEGRLLVTGSIATSATTVGEEGTLGGNGTLGVVTVAGTFAPGVDEETAGTIATGSLTLLASATIEQEIGGRSANTFDAIAVTGTLELDGASLDLSAIDGYVGAVGDAMVLIANDGADAVIGTFDGHAEGDLFEFAGQSFTISYVGGDGNDVVLAGAALGDAAENTFRLTGSGKTAEGLDGDDTYYVDARSDRVVEDEGGGTDSVYATRNYALSDEVENLYLTGRFNGRAAGNAEDNIIYGNAGRNVINGGEGRDTLKGRGGADIFVFDAEPGRENADTILGFQVKTDRIKLDVDVYDALDKGRLDADVFKKIGQKADLDDRIFYNADNGNLFYDANGSAKGGRDLIATIDNHPNLSSHDIFIA